MKKAELFPRFNGFSYTPILGGYEQGVTRRDPSPVIKYKGLYYVWYSRTTVHLHGYTATIWYATSEDGHEWTEQKQALPRGGQGAFDEHAVFTPSIFIWDNKFYMSYTGVPEPFYNGVYMGHKTTTKTAIGLAQADSPEGPWTKLSQNPILVPPENPDLFDSLRVDDSCFVVRDNKIFMYYKGRQIDHTPGETKMGLAIAEKPEGPYARVSEQPIVKGGHEVCCWPHGTGVAAMFCNIGEAGNSLQYSENGIDFTRICDVVPPHAPGPYREDNFATGIGPGICWGISIKAREDGWPYLARFDCNLSTP